MMTPGGTGLAAGAIHSRHPRASRSRKPHSGSSAAGRGRGAQAEPERRCHEMRSTAADRCRRLGTYCLTVAYSREADYPGYRMTRYYFDIREGDDLARDEEGLDLSTLQAVQEEAARSLADMARDAVRGEPDGAAHDMAVEVRDADGPVMQVKFSFRVDRQRH